MNSLDSNHYNKQEWEFFIGGIYSSTAHLLENLNKTVSSSRKSINNDENNTTFLLDEMWMTEQPSQDYKDFVSWQNSTTPMTDYIKRVANGPLWDSLIWLKKNNKVQEECNYDDNIETYNILMRWHDGKNLPSYRHHWGDSDYSGFTI